MNIDVDLSNPDTFVDGIPFPAFQRLRTEAPLYWQPETNGRGFWCVTRYDDLMAVSKDPLTFSSARGGTNIFEVSEEDMSMLRLLMLNMDPPKHNKFRRLVSTGFTARMVTQLEPHVRGICRTLIDNVMEHESFDFVTAIAAELPLLVIAELLGVPAEDRHKVFEWSNSLVGFDDPEYATSMETGKMASAQMWAYANQLANERKEHPLGDLVSVLMQAEVDGDRLSEMEFDSFFLLLAVAGNETTRNLISGGMRALIEHPEERARLVADPSLLPTGIEELLRWVSPLIHFRRTATRDVQMHGHTIKEGDKVVIFYPSANRDERKFVNPETFDVTRAPNEHLAFGIGEHFCLGANLARLEIKLIFEEMLRRLPDLEFDGPVRRLRSNFINGIKAMPVRRTSAAPQRREA
ncbi:MAG: cytochrome P450 [Candidatus Binatia bacterium]